MAQKAYLDQIKDLPTAFVIFGATGDLARKKIFPSFYELSKNNLLPGKFKIIAAARSKHTTESFLAIVKEHLSKTDETSWKNFASKIEYFPCDVAQNKKLDKLQKDLDSFEVNLGACVQRVFYLAVAPDIYEAAFKNLGEHKFNLGCTRHQKKARIVIEKPFGYDFESSQKLQKTLSDYFEEKQIFRIDHFLGKETVQNIFAFRFGNEIFEPIWNNKFVDNIQITFSEYKGIDKRGSFYDKVGALRDVVQNHLLQLLTLVTMDEPKEFTQKSIRDKKLEILNNIKKMSAEEVEKFTIRGQYEGYRDEDNIGINSQTETFAMVKLLIENERWQNVPVYIRTGKKLMGNVTSIIVSFKDRGHPIFENFWDKPMPNHVTIQIQPSEGIGVRLVGKKPGLVTALEPIDLEYCYKNTQGNPSAYERLLMDIIAGDQTLFLGQIGPSWKFIDQIREVWDKNKPKLATYKPGGWGPEEAEKLLEKDDRQWLAPLLTICKI